MKQNSAKLSGAQTRSDAHKSSDDRSDSESYYDISIDQSKNCVLLRLYGHIGLRDLVAAFSDTIKHPEFKINMNACYDMSKAIIDVDLKETEVFFHFASGLREQRGECYKLAFVYSDEMAKMLVNIYQLFLARTDIEVYSTASVSDAIKWLED